MTIAWPVSSQEAAELREREAEQGEVAELEALEEARERAEHSRRCLDGWLDGSADSDHPRPCPQCRPWTATRPCPTCGVVAVLCERQIRRGRGSCCPDCRHGSAR
jgi:hypothetical protein